MKEIKAYVRRDRLNPVVYALAQIEGLSGVSVSTVSGFGRSRGILSIVDFETHIKVEAVCDDDLKEMVVRTVLEAARTNHRSDGRVFVTNVEEAYRIETGTALADEPS